MRTGMLVEEDRRLCCDDCGDKVKRRTRCVECGSYTCRWCFHHNLHVGYSARRGQEGDRPN